MIRRNKHILMLTAFLIVSFNLLGQVSFIETPKPATSFSIPVVGNSSPNPHNRHMIPNPNAPRSNNPMDMYERDKRELQQRNAELYKTLYEYSTSNHSIRYDLPSEFGTYGTQYYQQALEELSRMLSGETPLNLKDAVFAVENAYFENQLNYSDFNNAISNLAEIARLKTNQDGYNWNNPITKNIMLFRAMADTLDIKIPQKETSITSYPMQYDFDDYRGEKNWSNMFVSKLLATHKGQCHSMPLLYLILCEQTGTEASLAYSPSHSYIKFKDNSGNWHNLELTNGRVVTDAFVVGSGYVTAEAIKNKTYMEPQSKQQVVAECLSDLAFGYAHKHGYDKFLAQCVDSVLKYDENNLTALMIRSNYETIRFNYVINQIGRPHPDTLKVYYPEVYKMLEDRNTTYSRVDASGHRDMPKDAYEAWLNSVDDEKERREYHEKHNKTLQLIR